MSEGIDFVVTWVDDSDPVWRSEKEKYNASYSRSTDSRLQRYRNWDLLKYWFRGVEKYASWVRKIHFVTCGHIPDWLNTEHPKIHIVNHKDYIPEKYLPTFNCNVLEMYLHKIPDLSEQFIYFNDDMYFLKEVKKEDFFVRGKPCDMLAFQPVVANPTNPVMSQMLLNNTLLLSKYFDKRECVKKHPGHYFKLGYPLLYFCYNFLEMAFPRYTGFYTVHGPAPFCKETFRQVWEKEETYLNGMMENRFRSGDDVTQYLFREWQKLTGNFYPKNIQRDFSYFEFSLDNRKLCETIKKQKRKIICINDTWEGNGNEHVRKEVQDAFESILSKPSGFEKNNLEEVL